MVVLFLCPLSKCDLCLISIKENKSSWSYFFIYFFVTVCVCVCIINLVLVTEWSDLVLVTMIWPGSGDRVIWPGSRDWVIWPGSGDGKIWPGSGWNWGEVSFRKHVKCVVKTELGTLQKSNLITQFFSFIHELSSFFPSFLFVCFVFGEYVFLVLSIRTQVLCESWGWRPGLPVPNSLYGLSGRKATLNSNSSFCTAWSPPSQAFNFYPLWDTTSGKRLLLPLG